MPDSLALVHSQSVTLDPRRAALAADPFEPQTPDDAWKLAQTVANTDFAPKDFKGKPEACQIAILYGRSLGLGALAALQNIGVINGRPNIWGDGFWAIITSHPDFEDAQEDVNGERAQITLKRRGRSPKFAEFSMADAKVAGLAGKQGPWQQYPKGQMMWRARHIAASALFSDALKGIAPREVALDYIEGEVVTPTVQPLAFANLDAGTKKEKPAERTAVPAKEDAKPAEEKPATITPAQGKEFNDARKTSGWSTGDTGAYLEANHGTKTTGGITVARFAEAMAWARKEAVKQEAETEKPTDEQFCRKAFETLDYNNEDAEETIRAFSDKAGTVRWDEMSNALHAQMEEAKQA